MSRTSRRSSMLVVAAGLALVRTASAQASVEAKSKVDLVEIQLKEAEERLGFVEQEYVQRKDATDEQLRQERFAKGASSFADADYNSASILFYDLVENPAFKTDPNYDDAVYYLGESLYQQQNLLGARHFFRELLNMHRSHYRSALARYLELAGKLNDFGDVAGYVDAARDAQGNLPAEVGYVYGKWLFKRQDIPLAQRAKEAETVLKPIAEGNGDDRLAAMYLMGVLEVQQGNYDEATETYTHLTHIGPRNGREQQIVELAHLALGRIAYEQSKFTEAIDAYQEVDRDSEHFTEALYEISWVFVKKGEYEKALRSTEILDELAPDSIIAPEAKVLRAHLYLKLARYGEATQTYKDVINAYAPVRDEVDALLKLHDDPVKYFDDLLAQNDKDFNVTSLLPPAAARWATTQQDVAEAVRVSGDLGASRKGVEEGNDLAQQILKQIDEKGANAFPVLQEGFSKAEAVDATLTNDSQLLVDAQRLIVESKVGDLAVELEAARKEREALEKKFKTLPQTDQDLTTRKARYQARLDEIDHTAFQLQNQVEAMNAALASIDKWVVDTRAERTNDPAAEKKFLADVKDVRAMTTELAQAVSTVRRGIKDEKLRSGNATADDQVRAQYQTALDREKAVLAQAASRLGPDDQALADRIAGVQKRVESDRARVASAKQQLQTAVANKAESIRHQVEEEQAKLHGYSGEVDNVSGDARNLVGRIAYDSFKRVRKQFYDMVLKADVGMVDVAWTKKQDDTNKIQELSKNKDKELKSLDDEFKEVLKDVDSMPAPLSIALLASVALAASALAAPKGKKATKAVESPDAGAAQAAPPPQACTPVGQSAEKKDAAVKDVDKSGLEQYGKTPEEKAELKELNDTVKEYEAESKEYRKEIQLLVEKKYKDKRDLLGASYEKAIADLEVVQRQERLDAIAQFEEFLQRYPDEPRYTPDVMYRLAELYYEKSEDDQLAAEKQYEATLKLVEEGKVAAAPPEPLADFSKSIAVYQRLLSQFADYRYNDGTYYLLGYTDEKQGKFEEAIAAYQTLIQKYPGSRFIPQAWMRQGEYYFDQTDDAAIKKAIFAYTKAVAFKDDPLYDKALYKLGWAYYKVDDFNHSVETFTNLLDYYQAKATGDDALGGDLVNEALQYTAISFADEKWGSVDKAKAWFAKVGTKAYEAEIFHRLGDVFFDQTKQDDAIASYRMFLSLAPLSKDAPSVQDRIVQAYERNRDFDRAFAEREVLIQNYGPNSKWADANKRDPDVLHAAMALSERSLYSSAIFHHKQALAYKTDGKTELAFKEFQTAARGYGAYLERFPHSKESYDLTFYYAECLYNSFDYEKAGKQYAVVRDSNADTTHTQEAAEGAVFAIQHEIEQETKAGKLPARPVILSAQRKDGEKIEPVPLPPIVQSYIDAIDGYLKIFPKCDRAAAFAHNAGVIYYTYNQFPEARTRFQGVITNYPESMVAKLATNLIVETFLSTKDWKQVEDTSGALAQNACKVDPTGEACITLTKYKLAGRFKLADELMQKGDYDAAAAKYIELVDEVQKEAKAGHQDAIRDAEQFADKALNNAAVCFEQSHRFDSALKTYERLYTDYPKSPLADAALFRVGYDAQQSYDFDKAIERYNKLIKDYPTAKDRPKALVNEAQLLEGDQRYKDAAKAFTQYAETFSDQDDAPDYAYHATIIYDRMKDYKGEIASLQEFQRKFGKNTKQQEHVVESFKRIAEAEEKLGNSSAALGAYKQCVDEYKKRGMRTDQGVASNAAAECSFMLAEKDFATFDKMKITGRGKALTNSFKVKQTAMKKAADAYKLVLPYKRVEWTLAAFYRLGFLLERFSNTVVDAPIPPEVKRLGDEAVASYQDQLGQMSAQLDDKAVEAYQATLTEAKKAHVLNNEWIKKTLESLNRYRPKEYPLLKDPKSTLSFDPLYQPQWSDTPDGSSQVAAPVNQPAPAPTQSPAPTPVNNVSAPAPAPAGAAIGANPSPGKVSGNEK